MFLTQGPAPALPLYIGKKNLLVGVVPLLEKFLAYQHGRDCLLRFQLPAGRRKRKMSRLMRNAGNNTESMYICYNIFDGVRFFVVEHKNTPASRIPSPL